MAKLNRAQSVALHRVWLRKWDDRPVSYLAFRRSVAAGYGCAMVQWFGMWLGIELDGYVHS